MIDPFEKMLQEAQTAAMKAFNACVPTPVSWVQSDLSNKPLSEPTYDTEGECGGAYITGIHGKDPFVTWCKKNKPNLLRKGVYKGYDMFLDREGYTGQSYEKYKAHAEAFAKVLNDYGVSCYAKSYLT